MYVVPEVVLCAKSSTLPNFELFLLPLPLTFTSFCGYYAKSGTLPDFELFLVHLTSFCYRTLVKLCAQRDRIPI